VVRNGLERGRGAKYKHLLADPMMERWNRSVARGSQITADVYLRRLGNVCLEGKIAPGDLVKRTNAERRNFIEDLISQMEDAKKAGSYIGSTMRAIKSWLAFNEITVPFKIKIRGAQTAPTLTDERVPTQEELRRVLMMATPREACAVVLVAHAGLRPESVGNYRGDDGLRARDLPEMKIEGTMVTFEKTPTMIRVRPELSKSGRAYFTFLGQEGCQHIKVYLEERLRKGVKVTPDTDIVAPVWADKAFLTSINVSDAVRKAIRSAGFAWRPYVLRAYFDTQLLFAESKGKMTPAYRAFLMGHVGDIEARYTTNKGRLSEEMIEDMREAYRRSLGFLETSKPSTAAEDDLKESFRRQILAVTGMAPDEIDKMNLRAMTDGQLQQVVAERLVTSNSAASSSKTNGRKQKVVNMSEVKKHLEAGWEWVATLPDNQAVIRFSD
jgi:hypothetical protein